MIRAVYTQAGDRHKLTVTGHAGYSEHGNDIVCAGVSAISYALLGFLHNTKTRELRAEATSGNMALVCRGDADVAAAFEMAVIGYMQISKKYPQYVDVYIASTGG